MTTLLQTQRSDPQDAEMEEKLLIILHNLGSKVIPSIKLEPFHDDLNNEPDDDCEDRELWEEQVGIKLAESLIFNAVTQMAAKLQSCREAEYRLRAQNSQLDSDKENVLRENHNLTNELLAVKQDQSSADSKKVELLETRLSEITEEKSVLHNQYLELKTKFSEVKRLFVGSSQQTQYENTMRSQDSNSQKRTSPVPLLTEAKKQKGVSPQFLINRPPPPSVGVNALPSLTRPPLTSVEINALPSPAEIETTPTMKRSRSRVLAGRRSPRERVVNGFRGDPSFVPETMKIAPSPALLNPAETQEVPESPEKPVSTLRTPLGTCRDAPRSPVLTNGRGKCLKARRKNRSDGPSGDDKGLSEVNTVSSSSDPGQSRQKVAVNSYSDPSRQKPSSKESSLGASRQKISPKEPLSDVSRRKVSPNEPFSDSSRQKVSPNEHLSDISRQKVSPNEPFSDASRHKVGRIAPDVQSTIDKKAYQDLDQDFPLNKRQKQSREASQQEKKSTFLDDSANDFESPNLLKKTKIVADREDEIEDFASPPAGDGGENSKNTEPNKLSKGASFKKPKMKKAENRWGIEVSELTESQSKRLKNQKQSKLDNFFGSKAKSSIKQASVKQVNYTDSPDALQIALKLSKETFELEQQQIAGTSNGNSREFERMSPQENGQETSSKRARDPPDDLDFSPDESGPSSPNYAYVNGVVRKRDERKKLRGFDCYECEEYYKAKLEEGYSEEQVAKMMNDCSKHRGKYKPPLTPEKFWDPDIIEGDPESPRNKTQVQTKPLMNRARRRALNREKNKMKNLENEEL